MGKLNVLKASWEGKVGQTVGSKWKNKSTIRTYTKPSNPRTQAQITVRDTFKDMTSFVSLFSDQIKYKSALDTSGMSVRNAIIKANKAQIEAGTFDKSTLEISRGGLPNVTAFAATKGTNQLTATFTAPVATNITENAEIVVVVVDAANLSAFVGTAQLSAGSVVVTTGDIASSALDVYYYVLDKRGSSKVGSRSGYSAVTA